MLGFGVVQDINRLGGSHRQEAMQADRVEGSVFVLSIIVISARRRDRLGRHGFRMSAVGFRLKCQSASLLRILRHSVSIVRTSELKAT